MSQLATRRHCPQFLPSVADLLQETTPQLRKRSVVDSDRTKPEDRAVDSIDDLEVMRICL